MYDRGAAVGYGQLPTVQPAMAVQSAVGGVPWKHFHWFM